MASSVYPRPLLTVQETASLLRVSERTVRRLIARGELPAYRPGRAVRVDAEAIRRFSTAPEEETT